MLFSFLGGKAAATTLILPSYAATNQVPDNGEAIFPTVLREQTVYSASEFPPYPILITEIRWRPDTIAGGPITTTISNIQVNLSTCTNGPDTLSGVFAQNTGADDTVVFSGAMNVNSSFTTLGNGTKAFDIDLPFQTSFLFDPAKGNLLLDLRNFTGCSATLYNNAASSNGDSTSRIYNSGNAAATTASSGDTAGGVIQLTYTAAPIPPSINSQPTNQSILIGGTASFAVTASGPAPLSYQWFFNNTNNPVGGATNTSLTLSNVQTNQAGNYFVQVSNSFGVATSSNAVLAVQLGPVITSQPADQTVSVGDTAVFSVTAVGIQPMTYQWFFNGTNLIVGATNSTLTITNIQIPQLGNYAVEVSNVSSSVASLNANLSFGFVVPNYAVSNQLDDNGEGIFTTVLREQTVYSASEFPPYPILITGIRWRPDSIAGGPISTTISNIQVDLSTTVAAPDALDYTFANNVGRDNTTVFSGAMNVNSSFTTLSNGTKAFDINLPLQTSFLFDSSKGNLLLDLRDFTACTAPLYNNAVSAGGDGTSRIYNPGSANATAASRGDTAGGVIQVDYIPAPVPPAIGSQPTNQTVTVGSTAVFTIVAGPPPLSYQWFFNTNNPINGATNASLILTNVQPGQAGSYSVQITNPYGTTNSATAVLTTVFPPAVIQFGSTNVKGGNSFDVPVLLTANGNENTLNFSVGFDTQQLTYANIALGSNALDGSLLLNTSQAANGRVGIGIQLPFGETFAAGTQEVAVVTFNSAIVPGSQAVVTPLNFTNQPINKLLFDAQGNKLATNFLNSSVTLSPSDFEADLMPRPTGDRSLDIFDWTEVGRMVAGLDVVSNASEFQRADCAPKATSGDGQLKVTDWVQAGRYGSATDVPTVVGGPTAPVTPTVLTGGPRALNISGGATAKGMALTVPVVLQSQGNESAAGFSINFDPTILKYASIAKGSAAASATMVVNTNQAAAGVVGVLIALPSGNDFASGAQEVVRLNFTALAPATNNPMTFADQPVIRAISDSAANELSANYSNSVVTVNPPPTLNISYANGNATLSWPAWAAGFNLQSSLNDIFTQGWTNVSSAVQTNGGTISVTVPVQSQSGVFRLQHP